VLPRFALSADDLLMMEMMMPLPHVPDEEVMI
jgi:hypothetical protein